MDCVSQFGALIILSITTATVVLFFFSKKAAQRGRKPSSAPQASGAWPVIGHLHVLSGRQLPHKALGSLADKHGPIFTLRLGCRQALVVNSWELAKEIFSTNDAAVSSRPPLTASKLLGYDLAVFAFSPYGPYWREMRKITVLELLSVRRLELLSHVRASELATSLKELHARGSNGGSSSSLVDLNQWVSDLALNVVLRMVAGKRYFGSGAKDGGEEERAPARRMQNAVRELFHYLAVFVVRDAYPFLGWADIGGQEKVMKRIAEDMDGILQELLDEHKRKRAAAGGGDSSDQQDFIDVLLSLLGGADKVAGYDSDTVIKATALVMFAAGTDTSTVTVTWAISLLLNNRQAMIRAQKELDDVVSKDRISPTDDEISKLVYLKAIVKETLRLYPPAPLSSPRQFTRDCSVGGYDVPEGTWLMVNLWKIHRDPRVWADPMEFRPERFLTTTHRDVEVRGSDYELMPFGSGRRGCPGMNFGLQMVHEILASVLHGFDVSTPDGGAVDMTESFGLTNAKATPLEVHVSARLLPNLF